MTYMHTIGDIFIAGKETGGPLDKIKGDGWIVSFIEALVLSNGRILLSKKLDPSDAATMARWLASQNSWGVLKYKTQST
ncbi:hypothetical protein QJS04_geneDACA022024 [Acorus gramineus]|uniref:Uncharacterized protein n=1 Tax=Acorus gramineus TaxID=55184 RepID=A0AAV9A3J2_ACOGR|nr:hypothetical protein QJS04_geneDACA022024 [Acorus gramineus]